jgi:hypothetical protein
MTSNEQHIRSGVREAEARDRLNRITHPTTWKLSEAINGVFSALGRAPYSPRRDQLKAEAHAWALACEFAYTGPDEVSEEIQKKVRDAAEEVAGMVGEDGVPDAWRKR